MCVYHGRKILSSNPESDNLTVLETACRHICFVLTHLFVKVSRPRDSERTFSMLSQAATCYYQSNHSKMEAIPLSALPKDTASELTGLFSTLPL